MDYAEIKNLVNVPSVLSRYGIELDKLTCACPIHGGDNKTAFKVASDGQGWYCHTKCKEGGDIFQLVERLDKIGKAGAKVKIEEMFNLSDPVSIKKPKQRINKVVDESVVYTYTDRSGDPIYTIERTKFTDGSKKFIPTYNGKHTLPEDVRTLYNLDKIAGNMEDFIIICEGEKVCDALVECEYIATCNPGGSNGWNPKYAELLRDQKIIIMPDADECGEKWRDVVIETLVGVVEQVQIIEMPPEFIKATPEFSGHDFADYFNIKGKEAGIMLMLDGIEFSEVMPNGVNTDLLGRPCDIWKSIVKRAKSGISTEVFNMRKWLPGMDLSVKEGDLIVMLGNTSTGKTRIMHNIPYHIKHLNYAIFDLELSKDTLTIRYAAMENKTDVRSIERKLALGEHLRAVDVENVFIKKTGSLTVQKIKNDVDTLEKATGRRMHCVAVDYIGLMTGNGSSYESTSRNVEEFKAYVSSENRVGILTSQVTRPEDRKDGMYMCPSPFSAKNTGSIENSAQLLLGFWKDKNDSKLLHARCMKYTHGESPNHDIELNADNLLITERSYYDA